MSNYCVYFIGIQGNEDDTQPIKIGKTNDIGKRLIELNTGSPYSLEVKYEIILPNNRLTTWAEKYFHTKFEKQKIHHEWFDIPASLLELEYYEEELFEENPEFEWDYLKLTCLKED